MNRRSLGALVAINAILLAALVVVSLSAAPAIAQFGLRGDYVMVAGDVTGRSDQEAVYILDLKSQKMITLLFDTRTNKLEPVAGRLVSNDLRVGPSR